MCVCVCVVGLVPDNEVRVSVKALAVSCVGAAATLLPEVFFNKLYLQPLEGQQPDGEKNTDHYPRILLIHGSIESHSCLFISSTFAFIFVCHVLSFDYLLFSLFSLFCTFVSHFW